MRTNPFTVLFIVVFGLIALVIGINVPFALLLFAAGLCYLLAFRVNLKGFPLMLFLIAFLTRLAYILVVDTPPASDFEILFNAGAAYAQGDYGFNLTHYFTEWAYQTAFVVYEGTIIKLFGIAHALLILKLLNALFSSATFLFVYLILKHYVSEKVSRFCALFGSFLIFPLTFVTVLSNQQLSTLLILIGLFFFTEKKLALRPWVRGLATGLFLALGNIIRPEGMIIMGALILFILNRLINPRQEKRKAILSKASFLFIAYFCLNLLVSQAIIQAGVNPQGLRNNNFLYKFVVGLNHETMGVYSDKDVELLYGQDLTQDERKRLEWEMIGQRLSKGPGKLLALFLSKQQLLWGGDPVIWSYQHLLEAGQPARLLGVAIPIELVGELLWRLHNLQVYFLILLSIIGGGFLLKGPGNHYFLVFYLTLLVSAGAYLFVEIQPRYIYLQEILFIITAAIGVEGILHRLIPKPKSQGVPET